MGHYTRIEVGPFHNRRHERAFRALCASCERALNQAEALLMIRAPKNLL